MDVERILEIIGPKMPIAVYHVKLFANILPAYELFVISQPRKQHIGPLE